VDAGDRGPLRRELIELKCRELGPVVFPAYVGTAVSVRARGMADDLVRSDDMARQIRQSLARDAATLPQVPEDPELRREVATSLLFPSGTSTAPPSDDGRYLMGAPGARQAEAAPPLGHPAPQTTDGAPLEREHPPASSTTDAPPSDGHPSTPENPRSASLRQQIREIAGLMKDKLPPIEEDKN
jgi:hypothetical protein